MKRIFPLGLITLGVLLSLGALSRLYLNNRTSPLENIELPEQLAGLNMTESKRGPEAIAEFADLHGKEFPVVAGAVAVYGNGQATLWVAGTSSTPMALKLTKAMQVRIAEGNSPFTPVNEHRDRNRKIYALEGMGQKHYYFQSENLVIWLAVSPALADQALQQILEVFP